MKTTLKKHNFSYEIDKMLATLYKAFYNAVSKKDNAEMTFIQERIKELESFLQAFEEVDN